MSLWERKLYGINGGQQLETFYLLSLPSYNFKAVGGSPDRLTFADTFVRVSRVLVVR